MYSHLRRGPLTDSAVSQHVADLETRTQFSAVYFTITLLLIGFSAALAVSAGLDDGINAPVMSAIGGLNAICLGVERALDRDISRRTPSSNRACA